jgi:hypothetical protein
VIVDTSVTSETASFRLTLESGTALTIDAASSTAGATTFTGESARFTFNATAGQHVGIGITSPVITNSGSLPVLTYRPDGTSMAGVLNCNGIGCSINLNNLAAGTYSVLVTPSQPNTATFNIQVNSDVTGTLAPGTAANINLKSGQNARYTFAGTAGESRAIEISQLATVPTGKTLRVYVYRPTDTIQSNTYYDYGGDFYGHWQTLTTTVTGGTLTLPALPTTGTYKVIVDTSVTSETATFSLKLL